MPDLSNSMLYIQHVQSAFACCPAALAEQRDIYQQAIAFVQQLQSFGRLQLA